MNGRYSSLQGQRVREVRLKSGIKQCVFARAVRVGPPIISIIEKGYQAITYNMAERLISSLKELGADVSGLINEPVDHYWSKAK